MPQRKQGFRFPEDWTEAELREVKQDEGLSVTKVVPVNIRVKGEHRVLHLDRAKQYLKKADEIWLMDCGCRNAQHHCDSPLHTCIVWDSAIQIAMERPERSPERITMEKAVETLERSHEAGLVHMAYSLNDDKVNSLCSCCSCCCAVLSANLRYGLSLHLLKSDCASSTDSDKCDSCGTCVDRCQFGARTTVDGSLRFDRSLCLGCGLCVTKCPTGAIALIKKRR